MSTNPALDREELAKRLMAIAKDDLVRATLTYECITTIAAAADALESRETSKPGVMDFDEYYQEPAEPPASPEGEVHCRVDGLPCATCPRCRAAARLPVGD